jgi:Fe-S oxidoreductase
MAHSNIAAIDQYEFKTIVTHCPHCFNTLKNEYPQFGGDYDVVHHSEYVRGLIEKGFLKVQQSMNEMLTYHDSCYLGRYNDIYDAPRAALESASSVNIVEMARSRDKGLCCGGGGAQVWFETHQEIPVNEIRLAEAMETGAERIGTACPFCTIMLTSAAQSKGVAEAVQIDDFAVLVANALV